jgi:Fe-S cluster biogenesis protein NfuA
MRPSPEDARRAGVAEKVERELERIRPYIAAHRGGVEVRSIDGDGNVELRFTGACEGCIAQPVTFASRVAPVIERLEGVKSVRIDGQISKYALARIKKYFYEE